MKTVCGKNFGPDGTKYAPHLMKIFRILPQLFRRFTAAGRKPSNSKCWRFALREGESILAVCQLNVAFIKGYDNKVLRLRHLLLSPKYDFSDDITVDDYVNILSEIFAGTIHCATDELPAKHVKLHLQSPADRQFFKEIEQHLNKSTTFSSVKMHGAWLYIDL